MDRGRLAQVGTPQAVYARPRTRFVASFIGRANLIEVVERRAAPEGLRLRARAGFDLLAPPGTEEAGAAVLRPEAIALDDAPASAPNSVAAAVASVSFLGPSAQIGLRLPDGSALLAEGPGELAARFPVGAPVTARWNSASLSLTQD